MIRVVVVDDSAFVRTTMVSILERDHDIKVVATARNGEEALECIRKHDPDVVTLDVEMPRMDGLTALKHIMTEMPRPVLMVSSVTVDGANETLRALDLGAADFIEKQRSPDTEYEKMIRNKVRAVASSTLARIRRRAQMQRTHPTSSVIPTSRPQAPARAYPGGITPPRVPAKPTTPLYSTSAPGEPVPLPQGRPVRDLIVIGVSTGGPPAVQRILSLLPAKLPACILIAQHMPATFTGAFAKRLDNISPLSVKEASPVEKMRPGCVYVCPGGKHLQVKTMTEAIVTPDPVEALYKPSANVLMESAGRILGRKTLGVMLTGMGNDGLEGAKILKKEGGRLLAQSESSCVVYGMPKAVVDAEIVDEIVDIEHMAQAIVANLYK